MGTTFEIGEERGDGHGLKKYAMSGPHTMKRDVWDAMELSAEATEGLLPWKVTEYNADNTPACLNGHAGFLDNVGPIGMMDDHQMTPALKELRRLGIMFSGLPDYAIERAAGGNINTRVPFAAVMQQLNIVRGDK